MARCKGRKVERVASLSLDLFLAVRRHSGETKIFWSTNRRIIIASWGILASAIFDYQIDFCFALLRYVVR